MSHDNEFNLKNDSPSPYGWTASHIPSKARLKELIHQIGPRHETASGEAMFSNVVDEEGEDALLDALAELRWMLDEGDGPDLATMKKALRDQCKRVIRPELNPCRREFLRGTAWWVVGASALTASIAKFLDHAYQGLTPSHTKEAPEHGHDNYAKAAHEIYEHYIEPYEDILVGMALVNEGMEKWKEIRLHQIARGVLAFTNGITREEQTALSESAVKHRIEMATHGRGKWVARHFFNQLLLKVGKEDFLHFIGRAQKAIDEQNELDLEIDLDPAEHAAERKIFDSMHCMPKYISFSDFLETWGWVLPGLAITSSGLAKVQHYHLHGNSPESESMVIKVLRNVSDPGQMLLGGALINECRLNWKKIKLEQLADVVIELGQKQIDWDNVSIRKLKEIIDNLDEPEEKFAGIRFFNTLLCSTEGKIAVHDFLTRARQVLDKSSAENLPDCFTPLENKIFRSFSCRPNLKHWGNSLHTVGWGLPGAICTITGLASTTDLACWAITEKEKTFAGRIKYGIHDYLGPIEGFTISLALINEAREQWQKFHLGQIGDAQASMVKLIEEKTSVKFH